MILPQNICNQFNIFSWGFQIGFQPQNHIKLAGWPRTGAAEGGFAIHQMTGDTAQTTKCLRVPLPPAGVWGWFFPGDSHFLDKSGFWVRKDVALIPAQSTAWAIEVDSQVSIISFHGHAYILLKERKSIDKINRFLSKLKISSYGDTKLSYGLQADC